MEDFRDNSGRFVKGKSLPQIILKKRHERQIANYKSGKIKPYWKGKKRSQEYCEQMSLARKGKKKPPRTEEHKKKIAESVRKLWLNKEYAERMAKTHIGHKRSQEEIENFRSKVSGSLNSNWKGGITPLIRKIRNCWYMQKWIRAVKERDKNCVQCGSVNKLHADHIKPFKFYYHEVCKITTFEDAIACSSLWDIKNGRTLCRDCHIKTDTYGNRKII